MRIRKLRLSGFKSFVEPAELIIERGLTGIVGPNGCGKSNLLEAIRWVMGESSPKSMRGGGMEDVIFAGTADRPPRAFAEVVLLAETDTREELEVVRRIERGTGSAYRINGKDARAKDVALVFADAATGAHSPALVSQGRISSVISAKPAERRLMLEEAAGIAGLHVRRKDAEQKLRATETNLARLEDIMAGLDRQIGGLRRQAKIMTAEAVLADEASTPVQRLNAEADLLECNSVIEGWSLNHKAAENEYAYICSLMDELEPMRQFKDLPLLEANEAMQRGEWLGELKTRAENFLLTAGTIPHDHLNTMRCHPDFEAEIVPHLAAITTSIANSKGDRSKVLTNMKPLFLEDKS